MQRHHCKTPKTIKNEGHTAPLKDHNNLPVTEPKDIEIYDLPNKDFKIAILWKLNELQENIEIQFNKIERTIHEQKEKFNKEKS